VSGWGSNQPTGLIQAASISVFINGTQNLVNAQPNGIRLWSLSIASICVTVAPLLASFVTEDVITDTNGVQYLACEMGMAAGVNSQMTSSVSQDMAGIVVPAEAALQLTNGGAGGQAPLRRCSATAVYTIL
jgi:hypothetical protein